MRPAFGRTGTASLKLALQRLMAFPPVTSLPIFAEKTEE